MIGDYANQTVIWQAVQMLDGVPVVNEYNEPTHATPVNIYCRFEFKRRMVRDKQGQQVISEARLFTESHVKPDDLITFDGIDWPVIAVADQPGLDGDIEFYEVMM